MNSDEGKEFILAHHGIKGMRWGVRRKRSGSTKAAKTTYSKAPGRLSETELKRRIGRMELEKKYSEMNASAKSPGKKYASNLLDSSGKQVVAGVVGTAVSFFVQRELKKRFGVKV